jgi:hypothetical protein
LKLIQCRIISWAGIDISAAPALISEVVAWEAISLSWKEVDEADGNYINSRLFTEVKETLLIRSLALWQVSSVS